MTGDFFQDDLPDADLYALGRILHDWSDDKIDLLLRKILARLPAGGGLLIAEKLLNEDGVGPVHANMQSLNMLVVTEGRERTLGEYSRLARGAGFSEIDAARRIAPRRSLPGRPGCATWPLSFVALQPSAENSEPSSRSHIHSGGRVLHAETQRGLSGRWWGLLRKGKSRGVTEIFGQEVGAPGK